MGDRRYPVADVLVNVSSNLEQKLLTTCIRLIAAFACKTNRPLASSMLAPAVPLILIEFNNFDDSLATFVVSSFVLGFAFGPLVVAPLSELYGRNKIYHVSNTLFNIFTIACGLSTSMGMLVAFRFLAGFAGVTVLTCGSSTIVDLMPTEQRGRAMALWSIGPLLGPVIGPVCAGFFVEVIGWRWLLWIITIVVSFETLWAAPALWLDNALASCNLRGHNC